MSGFLNKSLHLVSEKLNLKCYANKLLTSKNVFLYSSSRAASRCFLAASALEQNKVGKIQEYFF